MNALNYEQSELYRLRHTAAHLLAQAVLILYPEAKLGIGPPIADGFYYDFDLGVDENGRFRSFHPDDLPRLEKQMRRLISQKHPLIHREVSEAQARQLFADQPYKLELVDELVANGSTPLSTYRQDSFEDLCRGPHVADTSRLHPKAFKLINIAGAYWRGDENRPMLQRIYGTAWESPQALRQHLQQLEEAKKRDHRLLGHQLEIFILDDEIGPGLPLWLPNGNILREELDKLAQEMEDAAGYQRVATPHLAKEELYLRSGHLPYYADDMYPPMAADHTRYYLKPMNCPFHHKIFGSKQRSYRDLPVRLAEYGMVYRYEQSGALFGLMRVRAAQQNDAHIYCSEAQLEEEFMGVVDLYLHYFKLFGIDKYVMRLSKYDKAGLGKKYVDDEPMWVKIEGLVRDIMVRHGVAFVEEPGEAAFYGPKIDVQIWSAIGREFSLATNQVDFVVPGRFELTFTNAQGEPETPLCIHRAPLGSHERFIGFLIEHYAGNFPVWLAPKQVLVIPITDAHNGYANELAGKLQAVGVRAAADVGNERMNRKIRLAQQFKVPYMLVVGDEEVAQGTVSVRLRDGRRRQHVDFAPFVEDVVGRINGRLPHLD